MADEAICEGVDSSSRYPLFLFGKYQNVEKNYKIK
uniref:Uncharacterized protein n=1 Tax=Siphoviridae sp. cttFh17 TaxID=2826491 RepID=A0A8S5NJX0_9CAUD|nr:MAG TPA: hypothetical protein [Siphoviridae sp. cttFh17]